MNCVDNSHDHRGHGPYRVTTKDRRARSSLKSHFVTPQYEQLLLTQDRHSDVWEDGRENVVYLNERAKEVLDRFPLGLCEVQEAARL